MRPLRSFLLILIFIACFTGLHYIIPANQLFPSIFELFQVNQKNGLFSKDDSAEKVPAGNVIDSLTTPAGISVTSADSVPVKPENLLIDQLKGFRDSLRYSKGQVRVIYYGDSQIEGDRITSFLRQYLRKDIGGTGPGLFLPLTPVMYTKSVWLRSSSNWKRYNYLSFTEGKLSHRNLGPFMTICRYLPDDVTTRVPEKAFVKIQPSNVSDSTTAEYDVLRVFYGNTKGVVNFVVKAGDNKIFADTLKTGSAFNEIACLLKGAKEILIEFTGRVSPDIYGISIESKNGVIVDNIPQRGSAGLEFTMVGRDNLRESFRKLSPDLFILHYGLNIVKNVREDYSYYQKGLDRQLSLLKEIAPLTPILVISVTDMAVSSGDSITSYQNIPAIINAQRLASEEAGVTFWDSYSAMGGESSIVRWAKMNPPLARKDYVHFTYPGADSLSRILASALFPVRKIHINRMEYANSKEDTIKPARSLQLSEKVIHYEKTSFIRSLISRIFKYTPDEPLIFSTAAFWLFFLVVLAGYSLVYKKLFIRNAYLFLVSLFFYFKSGGLFLLLLIFVIIIDFTCGLLIYHSRTRPMRRLFVIFSIVSNLGLLTYFKYTGFFVGIMNDLFGTEYRVYDFLAAFSNSNFGTSFNISNIILPVGISFFTFQSLSYTFDIYKKKLEPVRNIIDFGFYVSFFPQLVAGPIVRASEFIPQLYSRFHLSKREFSHALFLISKGLIKKIIISDFIAISFLDRVFDAPSLYSGFENLMAVYGYGLQIYCDFSGYTDIAIGLGLILGFRLPVNFNSPYKAAGIADFWKRWHISLSRWLKDFLYIPLGGNRKGKIRTNINLLITMLLGGLWHGASIRFIIWGLLHGIGLVINRIWNSIFGDRLKSRKFGRAIAVFITFQFVSFCWIFFRAPDMNSVNIMLRQIIENFSPGSYMAVIVSYSSAFLLMAAGYGIHFIPERIKESFRGLFIGIPMIAQLAVIMIVAVLLFQMRTTEVMPFIYFRF
jgi:alginate O-acetyltransferase complex protein AlgI